MSYIDASMEPMIGTYVLDTSTLLDELDEILLEGEKQHNISSENINEIFRIMHTIKGSSAMMGIETVSTLAHRVEDLFFIIREHNEVMDRDNSVLFDLLFKASDFFKSEVELLQEDSESYYPADSSNLIEAIAEQIDEVNAFVNGTPIEKKTESTPQQSVVANTVSETVEEENIVDSIDDTLYKIRVFFEDGCQMENIRAFMLISKLQEACDYIESIPENPESNSACSSEIATNGLLIKLKTTLPIDDIYSIIENSVSMKSYEVEDDAKPNVSNPAEEKPKETVKEEKPAQAKPEAPKKPEQPKAESQNNANKMQSSAGKQSLISVNQSKLDLLMDIMGEIVINEAMVTNSPDLKGLQLDNFNKSARQLRKLTDQLQDVVMSIRMVPINGVFQKMNRIVRDMNKKLGKEVELVTIGGDTEVDKTINDALGDPFMHMIRNAMDHAIELPEERLAQGKDEKGTITLSAQNIGGEIVIILKDDGCGLNREKILAKAEKNGLLTKAKAEYTDKEVFGMIMLPGFSTNETVTEFSGRGVGMDVVRQNLEKVSGSISVDSVVGEGTTFTIKIPLTLAIVAGMTISVYDEIFTVPITSIRQTFKLSEDIKVITDTSGREVIMLRGECYPIIRLHELFNVENGETDLSKGIFLLIENSGSAACIFADELLGEQKVVVKPFPTYLNKYNIKSIGLTGCTIMGDGSISLILDIDNLLGKH